MKVQRVLVPNSARPAWTLLDDDFLPIGPVHEFLTYLNHLERSPNTLRAYAHHLKLFWIYLGENGIEWAELSPRQLVEFVSWLRRPEPATSDANVRRQLMRGAATINVMLAAVAAFYEYHERLGAVVASPALQRERALPLPYKSFFHHLRKRVDRERTVKLRAPKRLPVTLSTEQVQRLVSACFRARDRFLVCLLYETGMRIGQALGLRHEDIRSYDNEIHVVPRDNVNGARAKCREEYVVHVSKPLMELYADYLVREHRGNDSDYVFVNCWGGQVGSPLKYATIIDLFQRLSRESGVPARPHQLRHTHATELLRGGLNMAYVQKRLGHAQIQTTMKTYAHLGDEDLKAAYFAYLAARRDHNQ